MKLKGLYTALVTPFDRKGSLDLEGLKNNIRLQLLHDVDGIVVLGTTGESPALTKKEKEEIVRTARKEIVGNTRLMVGTGSYSTEETIEQTKMAEAEGADSALIVSPYYNRPGQEGLRLHFEAVCSITSLPVCLYNHPGRTGVNLETETVKRLAEIPAIVGIKEASGNFAQMNAVLAEVAAVKPEFSVLAGDDLFAYPFISLGGHGVISVIGNLFPKLFCELVHAALSGKFTEARAIHHALYPYFKMLSIESNPIPVKAAMNALGMAAGPCRLPLSPLQERHRSGLIALFQKPPLPG